MPPRKRKPLAAQDPNVGADAAADDADAGRAKALQIIQKLDAQVHDKCGELMRLADDAAVQLKQEYTIQLLKLPKKVRSLPLVEFQREYAGDIEAALLARVTQQLETARADDAGDAAEPAAAEPATVTRTTRRARRPPPKFDAAPATQTRRGTRLRGGETPAPAAAAAGGKVPGTSRAFRPGEVLYSQTGSPVDVEPATLARHAGLPMTTPLVGGTVLATPMPGTAAPPPGAAGCATVFTQRPQGRSQATQGRTILVTTQDGRQVVVTEDSLKDVPAELRAEVQEKLLELYRTVASVVKPPAAGRRK